MFLGFRILYRYWQQEYARIFKVFKASIRISTMFTFLKRVLQIFITLFVLAMVATIGIVMVVNPNDFKPAIEQQAFEQTRQVLKIQGPLSWHWFPLLTLELENVVLENPPPFKNQLLSAKSIVTSCDILSIFSGKILLNLEFQGLNLILERSLQGKNNWDELKDRFLTSPNQKSPNPSYVFLNGIKIENAQVIFHDDEKNVHYMLDHLNLSANNFFKGVIGIPNPLSLDFHLEHLNKHSLGNFSLTGEWSLKETLTEVNIKNLVFNLSLPNGKPTLLKGHIDIQNLNQSPIIQGTLESQNFDLKAWLEDFEIASHPSLPAFADLSASFQYLVPYLEVSSINIDLKNQGALTANIKLDLSSPSVPMPNFEGNFSGQKLQFNKIVFETIKGNVTAKTGVVNIKPLEIQMAHSQHHATLQIDLQGETPRYFLTEEAKNFEINELLTLLDNQNKLEGQTSLKVTLATQGKSWPELQQSLAGQAEFQIANGKFYGLNLIALLKHSQNALYTLLSAFAQKQSPDIANALKAEADSWGSSNKPSDLTPFDLAKANFTLARGIINNPNFTITHSEYSVQGSGHLNLNDTSIQYQLSALLNNNPYPSSDVIGHYLSQAPVLLNIQGTLADPRLRPDLESYLNNALAYVQKNVVEKLVDKTINKALDHFLKP